MLELSFLTSGSDSSPTSMSPRLLGTQHDSLSRQDERRADSHSRQDECWADSHSCQGERHICCNQRQQNTDRRLSGRGTGRLNSQRRPIRIKNT